MYLIKTDLLGFSERPTAHQHLYQSLWKNIFVFQNTGLGWNLLRNFVPDKHDCITYD